MYVNRPVQKQFKIDALLNPKNPNSFLNIAFVYIGILKMANVRMILQYKITHYNN